MRVLTVIGNRPQFIKAAAVSAPPARRRRARCSCTRASTTTPSSRRSSSTSSGCPRPEHRLDLGGGSNTRQTARMLAALEPLLAAERAGRGARLRRHELDAGRRAGGGAGRDPGGARRGRDALLRPHDARGAQPRADRPRRRPAAVLVARRPPRSCAASGWPATIEVVGDVMVDVALLLGPRAAAPHGGARPPRGGAGRVPPRHRAPRGQRRRPGSASRGSSRCWRRCRTPSCSRSTRARARGSRRRACSRRLEPCIVTPAARLPRLHRAAATTRARCSPTPAACRRRPTWPGVPVRDAARDARSGRRPSRPAGTRSSTSTRTRRSPRSAARRRRTRPPLYGDGRAGERVAAALARRMAA